MVRGKDEDWQLDVGEGWRPLVNSFVEFQKNKDCIFIAQVKEKFGGLRIYLDHAFDCNNGSGICEKLSECYGATYYAEILSYKTCEACGREGKLRSGGWIKTLCDEHAGGRPEHAGWE